jgi:hypothetical protein
MPRERVGSIIHPNFENQFSQDILTHQQIFFIATRYYRQSQNRTDITAYLNLTRKLWSIVVPNLGRLYFKKKWRVFPQFMNYMRIFTQKK